MGNVGIYLFSSFIGKKRLLKNIENLDPPCVSKIHLIKCKWFRLGPDSAPSSEATVLDVE